MTNTVQQALEIERKNIRFNPQQLSQFLYGAQQYKNLRLTLERYEPIQVDLNLKNKSRQQIIKQSIRKFPKLFSYIQTNLNDQNLIYLILCSNSYQFPGLVHVGMFMKYIEIMGTQQQKREYMAKCEAYEIVGCYAQTQMAHGSDVRSLMTTATFNEPNDQFIIDTPGIEAIKFWPGELGLYSTHALVFAQLIINQINYGVQAFILRIRNDDMKPMPGIEVGDIGPKIGYSTRDNGYLAIHKVAIPRKDLLSRFVQVSRTGQVSIKGNPKVAYATMMEIRKLISCSAPKTYACAITISAKYSIFRTQFKNTKKEQIKILDYQLQQQKIIQRIAQYYAITVAGNKINKISSTNVKLVTENEDSSLMEQTHCCLSLGKPYFTEIVYDGMEICRKACGGHGFSNYAGIAMMINEYAANLTHQGENTVLYLQVARYLIKNSKIFLTKKQSIRDDSIKYLQKYNQLLNKKCEVSEIEQWTINQLQTLLAQGVCYFLSQIYKKSEQAYKQNLNGKDIQNKLIGITMKNLAILHSIYFTYHSLKQKIDDLPKSSQIRQICQQLCLLFGVSQILTRTTPFIQGNFLNKQHIGHLKTLKQQLLAKIRPSTIGLVDGFGIPDKYINSALIYGNPYENFLKLARENQLNNHQKRIDDPKQLEKRVKNPLQSVKLVKQVSKFIKNPNPNL